MNAHRPFEGNGLGHVTHAIVTGLIAKSAFDRELAFQLCVFCYGDIANQPELSAVDRQSLIDRGEMQHLGRRSDHWMRDDRVIRRYGPFNRDIALDARRVDVHARLQLDLEGQGEPLTGAHTLCARRCG